MSSAEPERQNAASLFDDAELVVSPSKMHTLPNNTSSPVGTKRNRSEFEDELEEKTPEKALGMSPLKRQYGSEKGTDETNPLPSPHKALDKENSYQSPAKKLQASLKKKRNNVMKQLSMKLKKPFATSLLSPVFSTPHDVTMAPSSDSPQDEEVMASPSQSAARNSEERKKKTKKEASDGPLRSAPSPLSRSVSMSVISPLSLPPRQYDETESLPQSAGGRLGSLRSCPKPSRESIVLNSSSSTSSQPGCRSPSEVAKMLRERKRANSVAQGIEGGQMGGEGAGPASAPHQRKKRMSMSLRSSRMLQDMRQAFSSSKTNLLATITSSGLLNLINFEASLDQNNLLTSGSSQSVRLSSTPAPSPFTEPGKVFRRELTDLLADQQALQEGEGEKDVVPFLVKKSIEFIQQFAQIEGLFRISASHSTLQDLKSQVDTSDDFGASAIDLLTQTALDAQRQHLEMASITTTADEASAAGGQEGEKTRKYHTTAVVVAHLLCGLLKQFLRELARPVLLVEMYEDWMMVLEASEQDQNLSDASLALEDKPSLVMAKAVIGRLPEEHKRVLCAVLGLSWQLSQERHRQFNKMTTTNMATVVGPNLLRAPDALLTPECFGRINSLAEFLIDNFPLLFPSDDLDRSCLGLSFDL